MNQAPTEKSAMTNPLCTRCGREMSPIELDSSIWRCGSVHRCDACQAMRWETITAGFQGQTEPLELTPDILCPTCDKPIIEHSKDEIKACAKSEEQ